MDNKTQEAYNAYGAAIKKGGLDKPHSAYMFLAYTAFELEKFDNALEAILKAEQTAEGGKDGQLLRLKSAIQEALKEREAAKAAIEGKKI